MKTLRPATCLIALAIIASSSLAAVAAQTIVPKSVSTSPLYFPNIDKNHDGFISRSELPEELHGLRVYFEQYDVNKDHRLSSDEYRNYLTTLASTRVGGVCNSDPLPGCGVRTNMNEGATPRAPPPPTSGP